MSSPRLVSVALPLPLRSTFTYGVPEGSPLPAAGARVLVPFGRRRVVGVVAGPGERVEGVEIREILEVVDDEPVVEPASLELAAWLAEHYLAPPGECYRLVMPPAGVAASRAVAQLRDDAGSEADPVLAQLRSGPIPVASLARKLGRDPSARLARLQREGRVSVEQTLPPLPSFKQRRFVELAGGAEPRGPAQAELLARLERAGGRAALDDLVADRKTLRGAVTRLARAGVVRLVEEREMRTPAQLEPAEATPRAPTPDQTAALEPLLAAIGSGGFWPLLLHGVTGSGKTEVYFRAVEAVLARGLGAILLLPEIALTPLLVRGAIARFGDSVSVLHSELSAGERHDQWWRIREGGSRVVVGARSAVFAPMRALGLIVVDEEHESAYKQEESPHYHARDTAVMRAKLAGIPVVLGSATPSMESFTNARSGKYRFARLPIRIGPRGLPRVEIVDRREVLRQGGDAILTPALRDALELRLERGEQSILLLNRRGYATSLLCRECGAQATCPNCSVCLTLHGGGRTAECHYCGHRVRRPEACAICRGEYLKLSGFGTEKVVETVAAAFPKARVERLDRDLASRRGAVARVLAGFEAGDTDVLVGTQMIAKGHDFPRVTLVGVIDADVGLGLPDFRAAERTFHLLTQVAGRAGRAELPGEVILQSHLPDHYAVQLACAQDFDSFYEREMEFRSTMGYPPAAALVNTVVRSRQAGEAAAVANHLARRLRERAGGRFRVLGPAQAPLARLRQEHRYQVLTKGSRPAMRDALRAALVERFGPVHWRGVSVDVDPVSLL